MPVEDMAAPPEIALTDQAGDPQANRSIWPAMYPRLLELVRAHRTTLVFVNYRRLAERLALRLNELAGEEVARAHHGSLAREARAEIEEALKAGHAPLPRRHELAGARHRHGRDRPRGAGRVAAQRLARAAARRPRRPHRRRAEPRPHLPQVPRRPRRVRRRRRPHAARASSSPRACRATRSTCWPSRSSRCARSRSGRSTTWRRSSGAPTRTASCRGPSSRACSTCWRAATRRTSSPSCGPRIVWDRVANVLHGRPNARPLAVANAGTIPDRGLYGVFLADGSGRVGELDEEMVYEARVGQTFLLGASSWRIERITRDRVLVSPAPGQPGQIPFWRGEGVGPPGGARPRRRRQFVREISTMPEGRALERLREQHRLDGLAGENLLRYLAEQRAATGVLPTDRTIVVERFRDEIGDWRLCVLSPFGGQVHAPWALALSARLRAEHGVETQALWSDDGIILHLPDADDPPPGDVVALDPDAVEDLIVRELGDSALYAARFRENAARALLIPRRRPGQRTPLWQQRLKAQSLLAATEGFGSFPVVLETYREVPAGRARRARPGRAAARPAAPRGRRWSRSRRRTARRSRRRCCSTTSRSTCTRPTRRRASAAPRRCRSTAACCASCWARRSSATCSTRTPGGGRRGDPPARTAAGPRRWPTCCGGSATSRRRRSTTPRPWRSSCAPAGRRPRAHRRASERLIAAEDAGRYRDATGAMPPPGLPDAFVEPVPRALHGLVRRYARTHGAVRRRRPRGALGRAAAARAGRARGAGARRHRPAHGRRPLVRRRGAAPHPPRHARGAAARGGGGARRGAGPLPAALAAGGRGRARRPRAAARRDRHPAGAAAAGRDPGAGGAAAPRAGLPAGPARRALRVGRGRVVGRRRRPRGARLPQRRAAARPAGRRPPSRRAGSWPTPSARSWPRRRASSRTSPRRLEAPAAEVLAALWDLVWAGEVDERRVRAAAGAAHAARGARRCARRRGG